MRAQRTVLLAYVLTAVLGNVCLMDGVAAAEGEAAEVAPPMSENIIACPWSWQSEDPSSEDPAPGEDTESAREESPCASGHCITNDAPPSSCLTIPVHTPDTVALLPPPTDSITLVLDDDVPPPPATESPPPYAGISTVVLRR